MFGGELLSKIACRCTCGGDQIHMPNCGASPVFSRDWIYGSTTYSVTLPAFAAIHLPLSTTGWIGIPSDPHVLRVRLTLQKRPGLVGSSFIQDSRLAVPLSAFSGIGPWALDGSIADTWRNPGPGLSQCKWDPLTGRTDPGAVFSGWYMYAWFTRTLRLYELMAALFPSGVLPSEHPQAYWYNTVHPETIEPYYDPGMFGSEWQPWWLEILYNSAPPQLWWRGSSVPWGPGSPVLTPLLAAVLDNPVLGAGTVGVCPYAELSEPGIPWPQRVPEMNYPSGCGWDVPLDRYLHELEPDAQQFYLHALEEPIRICPIPSYPGWTGDMCTDIPTWSYDLAPRLGEQDPRWPFLLSPNPWYLAEEIP